MSPLFPTMWPHTDLSQSRGTTKARSWQRKRTWWYHERQWQSCRRYQGRSQASREEAKSHQSGERANGAREGPAREPSAFGLEADYLSSAYINNLSHNGFHNYRRVPRMSNAQKTIPCYTFQCPAPGTTQLIRLQSSSFTTIIPTQALICMSRLYGMIPVLACCHGNIDLHLRVSEWACSLACCEEHL